MSSTFAGDITVLQAWEMLGSDKSSILVDVRTPPEWAFSGVPELGQMGKKPVMIPWKNYPTYEVNKNFSSDFEKLGIPKDAKIFFMCRTGGRSTDAATFMAGLGYEKCYNVKEGFEGPHNPKGQRGTISGWKASGLPWVQS